MKVIENIIPNFSNLIESSHVLSPEDIENEFGLKEGNLNHGEISTRIIIKYLKKSKF